MWLCGPAFALSPGPPNVRTGFNHSLSLQVEAQEDQEIGKESEIEKYPLKKVRKEI